MVSEAPDVGEQMLTYGTLAEMIHLDTMRGIVTEKGKETAETGAATTTKIVKGVELALGNAEGGLGAVKRKRGNVAEKGVGTRIRIKTRTRIKIKTRIKTKIRTRIRTRTESVSVGVVVGTGKGIETVIGKRKMSVLKESLKKLQSLLVKSCQQGTQAWMASR